MPIPKYFINERAKALKEREKLLGSILAKLGPQDKEMVRLNNLKYTYHIILTAAPLSRVCRCGYNAVLIIHIFSELYRKIYFNPFGVEAKVTC